MKTVETWIYAILLVCTLAWAYTVEKEERPETKTDVVAFDPHGARISKLSWEGKRRVAHLTIEGAGDEFDISIRAGRRKRLEPEKKSDKAKEEKENPERNDATKGSDSPAPSKRASQEESAKPSATPKDSPSRSRKKPAGKASPSESANPSSEGEKPAEPRYGEPEWRLFPGNQQARKLVEDFSPLKALREFRDLSPDALSEMGFDDPKAVLTIEAGTRTLRFEVGEKAYGSSKVYIRPEGGDRVYLVPSKVITPLKFAEDRLRDRNPLGFEKKGVRSVTISEVASGREARLEQQGRHDPVNAYWTKPGAEETHERLFDDFMEKLFLLRVVRYPTETERPAPGDLEEIFEITFTGEEGQLGELMLARKVSPEKSSDETIRYTWYATTPHTRSWAVVTARTAEDLVEMLPSLFEK